MNNAQQFKDRVKLGVSPSTKVKSIDAVDQPEANREELIKSIVELRDQYRSMADTYRSTGHEFAHHITLGVYFDLSSLLEGAQDEL